jgi:hypothetical protein
LPQRNPFSIAPSLKNIAMGVTAHTNIKHVHDAKMVNDKILVSMEGQKVTNYTFKRSL